VTYFILFKSASCLLFTQEMILFLIKIGIIFAPLIYIFKPIYLGHHLIRCVLHSLTKWKSILWRKLLADYMPSQTSRPRSTTVVSIPAFVSQQNTPKCFNVPFVMNNGWTKMASLVASSPIFLSFLEFVHSFRTLRWLKDCSTVPTLFHPTMLSGMSSMGEITLSFLRKLSRLTARSNPIVFFSDPRDIAFSLAIDGFLLFNRRRGGPSATPLLVKVFNLDPLIRSHLEHLICVGTIPGPKQPKDLGSFLVPFDNECALMACGIQFSTAPLTAYSIFMDIS
jgi:hypothetical protein